MVGHPRGEASRELEGTDALSVPFLRITRQFFTATTRALRLRGRQDGPRSPACPHQTMGCWTIPRRRRPIMVVDFPTIRVLPPRPTR
jgi:hypothetical protein